MDGVTTTYGNMHVGTTAMPRAIPAKASKAIFEGDFNGIDFLDKRESDRLVNAAEFVSTADLPEMFKKSGIYRIPQLTIPHISLPDGSVHQARSQTYVSIAPQEDGRTKWTIIAQPMVSQVKPFYYQEGYFDAESSTTIKESTADTLESKYMDMFMDDLAEAADAAPRWGAILFERFFAQQIQLPESAYRVITHRDF